MDKATMPLQRADHVVQRRRARTPLRPPRSAKKRRLTVEEEAEETKRRRFRLLQSAFGPEDRVDESNWITSTLIDLMLWKFATLYPTVHFLPTAFYHLQLETGLKSSGSPWQLEEEAEETKRRRFRLLQSAFGPEDRVDESNWITSTLIDLMLWKFATLYPTVHFLPTAFYHLQLETGLKSSGSPWQRRCRGHRSTRDFTVKDVLGRVVDYDSATPLVFVVNVDRIHWNLFRVQLEPTPTLQLFEPMGKLASRSGISYRSVPRAVIEWLDGCYPQQKGWLERTVSAITKKHQISGFDCGVACLLYADKCGRGLS
ncbi:Ubiquitin-1-specific protease, partial [Phytophthora palmivora]